METPQHRRPLWIGLLACAIAPSILLVVDLLGSYESVMIPVEVVLIVSLPASFLATYLVAFPYVLWLRRRHKLSWLRLCIAGALVGAGVLGAFNFYMNWFPEMRDHQLAFSIALKSAGKGALSGSILGAIASAALAVGSGIPIRRPREEKVGAV